MPEIHSKAIVSVLCVSFEAAHVWNDFVSSDDFSGILFIQRFPLVNDSKGSSSIGNRQLSFEKDSQHNRRGAAWLVFFETWFEFPLPWLQRMLLCCRNARGDN